MTVNLGKHTVKTVRRVHITDAAPDGRILGTGHTTENSGTRTGELELVIDEAKLLRLLAERALLSKGRRMVMQQGSIILRMKRGTESETHIPHTHGPRCYTNGQLTCDEGRAM